MEEDIFALDYLTHTIAIFTPTTPARWNVYKSRFKSFVQDTAFPRSLVPVRSKANAQGGKLVERAVKDGVWGSPLGRRCEPLHDCCPHALAVRNWFALCQRRSADKELDAVRCPIGVAVRLEPEIGGSHAVGWGLESTHSDAGAREKRYTAIRRSLTFSSAGKTPLVDTQLSAFPDWSASKSVGQSMDCRSQGGRRLRM